MFAEKVVTITGASSGLGRQLAHDLAARRCRVVLFARNADALAEAVAECEAAGGEAMAVTGDVTQPEDCERLIAKTTERFGGIDFLISNAGLSMWAKFEEVTDLNLFRRLMEVNYLGLVHTLHFALPALKKTGGLIVSIGSIQGKIAVPAHSGYVASKHALEGFCDTLRYELEETGVDILTVHPHWIQGTNMRANACTADGTAMGESKRSHNHESITLEQCAREIIDAMRERRRELIIPPRLRLAPILKALWPALLRRKVLRIFRGQGK